MQGSAVFSDALPNMQARNQASRTAIYRGLERLEYRRLIYSSGDQMSASVIGLGMGMGMGYGYIVHRQATHTTHDLTERCEYIHV